jgi:hypothetical protein
VRSALAGLALWWLDHAEVRRAVLVGTMVDVLTGLLEHHRPPGARRVTRAAPSRRAS